MKKLISVMMLVVASVITNEMNAQTLQELEAKVEKILDQDQLATNLTDTAKAQFMEIFVYVANEAYPPVLKEKSAPLKETISRFYVAYNLYVDIAKEAYCLLGELMKLESGPKLNGILGSMAAAHFSIHISKDQIEKIERDMQ